MMNPERNPPLIVKGVWLLACCTFVTRYSYLYVVIYYCTPLLLTDE